jgi:AraC family transcriptional regulator of adaptative response / DNA-3-methyladenine glycosylase II
VHRLGPAVPLELPFERPLLPDNLFGHLAATAVPGVEQWRRGAYRRTLRLTRGVGIVALRPPEAEDDCVRGELWLSEPDDVAGAVRRCRGLLDLDVDPVPVDTALAADPVLAPLVVAAPGRRVPGTVDPAELAVRAVLGQQVSTAAARTHAARLVAAHGERIEDPDGELTSLFPTPGALRGLDPAALALPEARKRTLVGLVAALDEGVVDLDGRPDEARADLLALPGIGPWTVETVAMRGLGDADAFLAGDLGVRVAAERLGLPTAPAALNERSRHWSPWRAYAVQHLWATGDHAVNRLPAG